MEGEYVDVMSLGVVGVHPANNFRVEVCRGYIYCPGKMSRIKPTRVVNTRTAVKCVIYPIAALEERKPEQLMSEVLKVKPVKKRLPGTALLIKLGKEREREKEKRAAERREKAAGRVDDGEVADAMGRILSDLE